MINNLYASVLCHELWQILLSTDIWIDGAEWLPSCLSIKAGEAAVVHSLESSLARSI